MTHFTDFQDHKYFPKYGPTYFTTILTADKLTWL